MFTEKKKKKKKIKLSQDSVLLFLRVSGGLRSEAYVEGMGSSVLFTQSHRLVLAVL
jgi:hypothetical protein